MTLTPRRAAIVKEAQWWLANTRSIHYSQIRPMPLGRAKAHTLPLTTDCSGAVTCIYYATGAPDPNDLGYSGAGFTGTLFANGEAVSLSNLEPGDLVIRSQGDVTEHVYLVLAQQGSDYLLWSHGREEAPETLLLSQARAAHPGQGFYGRSYLVRSTEQRPVSYRWIVLNGAGERIGRTLHPVVWATRHPLSFRKFANVRFVRRSG